jgi:hypothetical protein
MVLLSDLVGIEQGAGSAQKPVREFIFARSMELSIEQPKQTPFSLGERSAATQPLHENGTRILRLVDGNGGETLDGSDRT